MIKPDIILIWPYAYDYPICRQLLVDNRYLFNQVIISFTHNSVERDFRPFLKQTYPDFTFVDQIDPQRWYHDAINVALDMVKSDWVLFLEQDFIYGNDFMENLLNIAPNYDFICHEEVTRLHLACCLTKISHINKTHRFFDQYPRHHLDCFDLFFAEMEILFENKATLNQVFSEDYYHLNGLTQNMNLALLGKTELLYKPASFKKYLRLCADVKIPQSPEWIELTQRMLSRIP